jgi:hypothetical protein
MLLKKIAIPRMHSSALNVLKGLTAITQFGHLRRAELGAAVWPKANRNTANQMGAKLAQHLLEAGFAHEHVNSLGTTSLVLSKPGVNKLKEYGLPVNAPGHFSSISGAQFFHRTLGTLYLLEKAKEHADTEVLGEYALQRGSGTISRAYLADKFHKFPDGLIIQPAAHRSYEYDGYTVDWVEVEYSYKDAEELDRIMAVAWQTGGWLDPAETLLLDRVIFVIDTRQGHESRILSAAKRQITGKPHDQALAFLSGIYLARAEVSYPLRWGGLEEVSAQDLIEIS